MASQNLARVPTGPLAKAFAKNVQHDVFDRVYLTQTKPTGDGVAVAGDGGEFAPTRILIFPYAECQPGQAFYLRLYGWRSIGAYQLPPVWVYCVLAEFMCVAGMVPGPVLNQTMRPGPAGFGLPLGPTENLCVTVQLRSGVLGATGFVNSMPPEWNLPAFAGVELMGSQLVSFDFRQLPDDETGVVAANCLWAMA